jgi:hypothetical protein
MLHHLNQVIFLNNRHLKLRTTIQKSLLFKTDKRTANALNLLGRSEDIHISPDGRYAALAGYLTNKILIVRIHIEKEKGKWNIILSNSFDFTSTTLDAPHGVFWIDDQHIMVANRATNSIVFKIPKNRNKSNVRLEPISSIKTDQIDLLYHSSCLHVYTLGAGLYEALICSNYGHYVSSHILDERKKFSPQSSIMLLQVDLNVPDGVAVSDDRRWIGVSNHDQHSIHIYSNDKLLDKYTHPSAILHGPLYPHGIIFFKDSHYIFVADAGAPYVYGFFSSSGNWIGKLQPFIKLQVMNADFFKAGHVNPQEGGPKGIYITQDSHLLIITCDQVRIAFFDLTKILKPFNHKIKKKTLGKKDPSKFIETDPLLRHVNSQRHNAQELNETIVHLIAEKNKAISLKIIFKLILKKCLSKMKRCFGFQ